MVATTFSSLAFLSLSVSMAKLSRLVAESFSNFALLSSSVSTANLRCLLETTFSSLSFLSNSFSSPHFDLLRVVKRCFSWSSVSDDFSFPLFILLALSFSRPIRSLSLLCSSETSESQFVLSYSFLSERVLFFVHANNTGVTRIPSGPLFQTPKTDFEHARVWITQYLTRILTYVFLYGFPIES